MAKAWRIVEIVLNWLTIVFLLVLIGALEKYPPYQRYVLKQNLYKYAYPLKPNSVPTWSVLVYSLLGPWLAIMAMLISEGWTTRNSSSSSGGSFWRRKGVYIHTMTLSLWKCVVTTGAITNCIKNPMGALRPNFVERCWPDGNIQFKNTRTYPAELNIDGGIPLCSGPKKLWQEGQRSFLSGHSSISMAGLGFLGFYLWHRLGTFSGNTNIWRMGAGLAPFSIAVLVGASRIIDYWHHWQDVVCGLLLGLVVAALSYRQFYFKVQASKDSLRLPETQQLCTNGGQPESRSEADFKTHNASVIFDRHDV